MSIVWFPEPPHSGTFGPHVFADHAFFDADACRRVRQAMAAGTVEDAEILEDGVRVADEVRRTTTIEVDQDTLTFVERALDRCRNAAAAFHEVTLVAREGASFLRYHTGGFYRAHRDHAVSRDWPAAARRRIAIVVFLNDDFTGGELRLFPRVTAPVSITAAAGTLVAFDARMLHEVLPVTAGTRETIVDWFYE